MSSPQLANIGSDNFLEPNRSQAVIWINDALVSRHIKALLGLAELYCSTNYFEKEALKQSPCVSHFKGKPWNSVYAILYWYSES